MDSKAVLPTDYDDLLQFIKPGQTWRYFFGKNHPANRTIHIRAVVDRRIVFKVWGRARWIYVMEHVAYFKVGIESGKLTLKKTPA